LFGIIGGLVGWINQGYILEQWRWWWTDRPFVAAQFWPYALQPAVEHALKPKDIFRECSAEHGKDYCPQMIVVPAGSFIMGSSATESGTQPSEQPQHQVTIARPFAVSRYALTFDEWDTCADYGECPRGITDSGWGRGSQPVINVTWEDAKRYVAWLSKTTGKPYRLLSEAEYEYAARAGSATLYPWGDDIGVNNSNCKGCGSQWDNTQTAPVGSFAANGFGLFDMVGNVWEWVEDCVNENYRGAPTDGSAWIEGSDCKNRIVRGGSWNNTPVNLRAANRVGTSRGFRDNLLGFRIARTLTAP
jgi:formylglycine-generating enzyme required for sulfatase activity